MVCEGEWKNRKERKWEKKNKAKIEGIKNIQSI